MRRLLHRLLRRHDYHDDLRIRLEHSPWTTVLGYCRKCGRVERAYAETRNK